VLAGAATWFVYLRHEDGGVGLQAACWAVVTLLLVARSSRRCPRLGAIHCQRERTNLTRAVCSLLGRGLPPLAAMPRELHGAPAGTTIADATDIMRSSLLVVIAACGSPGDSPLPGDAPPVVEPCSPSDDTIALAADSSWMLGSIAVDEAGPWFALAKQRDSVTDFVIVDRSGEVATLIPGVANASGLDVAAVQVAGERCVAMHTFDEEFHFACEGGNVEIPGLDLGGKMKVIQVDDTVHAFGQDFAAYHELRRTGGSWFPIEKFESSVSKAEDAVRYRGSAVACFLDIDDRASIDLLQGDPVYGDGIATWCRLIPDDDELGVLTDLGFTTFTGRTLGGWQPTAADVRPLAVGRRDGAMFAVIRREDRVELQPLPTGAPTVLRTLSGSSEFAQAVFDGDRVIVTSVKSTFEAGAELTSSTRCME
jgi:hypothetical protein